SLASSASRMTPRGGRQPGQPGQHVRHSSSDTSLKPLDSDDFESSFTVHISPSPTVDSLKRRKQVKPTRKPQQLLSHPPCSLLSSDLGAEQDDEDDLVTSRPLDLLSSYHRKNLQEEQEHSEVERLPPNVDPILDIKPDPDAAAAASQSADPAVKQETEDKHSSAAEGVLMLVKLEPQDPVAPPLPTTHSPDDDLVPVKDEPTDSAGTLHPTDMLAVRVKEEPRDDDFVSSSTRTATTLDSRAWASYRNPLPHLLRTSSSPIAPPSSPHSHSEVTSSPLKRKHTTLTASAHPLPVTRPAPTSHLTASTLSTASPSSGDACPAPSGISQLHPDKTMARSARKMRRARLVEDDDNDERGEEIEKRAEEGGEGQPVVLESPAVTYDWSLKPGESATTLRPTNSHSCPYHYLQDEDEDEDEMIAAIADRSGRVQAVTTSVSSSPAGGRKGPWRCAWWESGAETGSMGAVAVRRSKRRREHESWDRDGETGGVGDDGEDPLVT
ncbi:hypothetical protein HDU93_004593, partial [Gonapodya sp. JEL0774]